MHTSRSSEFRRSLTLGAGAAALATACRAPMPTRPDDLREGTFAFVMSGKVGRHRVALDEVVAGTACRANDYILLDDKSLSRRFSLDVPEMSATPARYRIASRKTPGAAHAHLNLPVSVNQGASLNLIDGTTSVVKRSADDVLGTFDGRLAQNYTDGTVVPESAFVRGVFRAKRCADWLELARRHQSAAAKK